MVFWPNKCFCIDLELKSPTEIFGRFVITPVNISIGTSIGNVLRRVLLTEVNGMGITDIRIQSTRTEFGGLTGVREDVIPILNNLRQIILTPQQPTTNHGEVNKGRLRKQGPSVVTAGDLELPADVRAVDPGQYILTIHDNSVVEFEFEIGHRNGYINSEVPLPVDKTSSSLSVGNPISPVTACSVTLSGEDVYPETFDLFDRTDYLDKDEYRLILDISTNGSITPQEALAQSAYVLNRWFETIESIREFRHNIYNYNLPLEEENYNYNLPLEEENTLEEDDMDNFVTKESATKHTPIEEMGLSSRAYKALKRAGIDTIEVLVTYSENELLKIKNFGEKSARELKDVLEKKYGIYLD